MNHKLASVGASNISSRFIGAELATAGSVLAAALEIVNGALQSPTRYGVILFVTFLIIGTAILIWLNSRKHGPGNTIIVIVAVILFSVLTYGARSMISQLTAPSIRGPLITSANAASRRAPVYYYMEISTFLDTDGGLDGQRLTRSVIITTQDPTDEVTPHRTGSDGKKEILLRNAGYIKVAVCGIYQTQFVPDTSTDRDHAVKIDIGLSAVAAQTCQ